MPNPNITPLAQDFVIAARVPDPKLYFFHDPNLARLDDGTLIVAAPQWGRRGTGRGTVAADRAQHRWRQDLERPADAALRGGTALRRRRSTADVRAGAERTATSRS